MMIDGAFECMGIKFDKNNDNLNNELAMYG